MSIKLSNRLNAIASFVSQDSRIIDVGTDHGYIPVFLVENGICKNATASDVNIGPLMSAKRTAELHGVTEKIRFVHTDGLNGISYDDGDTVVIAGMGGETIVKILSAALWVKDEKIHLILQPQSKITELTEWLDENGFLVDKAVLASDDRKIYLILSVCFSGKRESNDIFGILKRCDDRLLPEYLDSLIIKNKKAISGMMRSKNKTSELELLISDTEALEKLKEELNYANS